MRLDTQGCKALEAGENKRREFTPALAAYFSLDGAADLDWAPAAAATAAARKRIYSFMVTVADAGANAAGSQAGAALFPPPISVFAAGNDNNPADPLRFPLCYTDAPKQGISGLPDANKLYSSNRANYRLKLTRSATSPLPDPWQPGTAEPELLEPPSAHRALLDLVRKLLAYRPADGFANALEAVREIDAVRALLADGPAHAAFGEKLACLATAPRAVHACHAAAALAMEQISQRDAAPRAGAPAAALRPDARDVAAALDKCTGGVPRALLLATPALTAIVGYHACFGGNLGNRAGRLSAPELDGAEPPAAHRIDALRRNRQGQWEPFSPAFVRSCPLRWK